MFRMVLTSLLALLALPLQATTQTADDIVAKHVEARGGLEKLKAVQSVRMTGRITIGPEMEAPLVMELKRPNKMRLDITVQGMIGSQAYDGSTGWAFMPFAGQAGPEPLSPDELKLADEQADIDGPLVDYKAKGNQVELVGEESVDGTGTYKLKITLKDGEVRYYFLDTQSFLAIRTEGRRTVRGMEMDTVSSVGDYRDVDGIMFPFVVQNGARGRPERQTVTVEKVELNVPVDDARFTMPEVKKD